MSLMSDLVELSRHLQQERLFVSTEREQLQQLYDSVRRTSEKLLHVAWIARHQKAILNACMVHGNDVRGINVCGQSNELENTNFVDSYKHFSHHDSKFGDLLKFLWDNPVLVGQCIYEGEKAGVFSMERIITTVTASIFEGCMFREDEAAMLQILKLLTEMQLANDDNPRRLLRRGSCAFFLLYKQLCDCLFSARLFLTAALHDPIMRLLMEDEWFYDIDPSKAMVRFPPKERQKRFGDPGTEEYRNKQQNYRKFIVDKLVMLAQRFITSIKANLHCFPPAIAWLTSHVFASLTRAGHVDTSEVRAACGDLVFALFICPAICDPEPYGITSDIPISHIARHNLMQIAQILQVLAISRWEEIDPKVRDLYGRFEKGCMSSVLDCFLEGPWDDVLLVSGPTPANLLVRSAVLMMPSEVKEMVAFLRQTSSHLDEQLPGKKQLEHILLSLPQDVLVTQCESSVLSPSSSAMLDSVTAAPTPAGLTTPDTPGSQRKLFKAKTVKRKPSATNLHQLGEEASNEAGEKEKASGLEDVLVITVIPPADCPGMITEKKVLAWEYENRRRKVKYPSTLSDSIAGPGTEIQEKRTRFSLSHDQESIGNTSDCQEAISEAASSHSVDENELDNFSDMMSANVSGRGSPSISGRDTPLSQAGSVEENPRGAAELPVPVPETVQKQNRVDVTDRFGKFDLEPGDEIKSTVSDTWSTDVLASDSEPPDQNQLERLEEVAEEMSRPFMLAARDQEPVSEISETASDAWSTDVLASDTDDKNSELLKELEDQDEVSSIVDRDEADSSVGQEDMGADEANMEALGAVGGVSLRSDELADFGDMLQGPPESPKQSREDTAEPMRKSNAQFSSPFPTQGSPQSLHPPQFHRSSHGARHEGRQSGLEPQHMVRRAWKERHLDPTDRYQQQQQQYPDTISQRNSAGGSSDVVALLPRSSAPHHSINPAINVWVSTNGQISGNSTRSGVVDKQQTTSLPALGSQPTNFNASPSRPVSEGNSDSQSQPGQQKSYNKDRMSQDSGNPLIEITEDIKSCDSPTESTDLLIDLEHTEPLTIAEQQNTCIDENRLSAALSMFDPFASEGEADGAVNDLNTNCSSGQNKSVYSVSSSGADNLGTVSSHSVDSAIGLLCEDDSAFKDSQGPKPKEDSAEIEVHSGKEAVRQGGGENQQNASSSAPVPSQRYSSDNISIRSDEKDFHETEDGDRSNKTRGFFRTFFQNKLHKGIKRKTKPDKEFPGGEGQDGDASKVPEGGDSSIGKVDISDDILAKYRTPKKGAASKMSSENIDQARDLAVSQNGEEERLTSAQVEDNTPFLDPSNLESCFAFQDAKRKLRLVLSMCEIQPAFIQMQSHSPRQGSGVPREQDLVYLLRWQLAEAINLQNKDLVTRLHEAIRCVKLFDADGSKKLLKSLREEYRNRAAYISYLVRCRQGLLAALAHLQKMLNRVEREREICRKHLINVCVRFFIDQHEQQVVKFISRFQSLAMSDEKTDLVEEFLQYMYQEMSQDLLWKAASESQSEDGKQAIERSLMSRIYTHAMFPNGDGDILRDQLIQQHIKKLSAIITPTHKDLRIPRVYHFECPWPAAQRDIIMINAYKTPKDKLKCVLRCSQTIMNLLSMANEKSVPAADDFMPVLIFVLIKANPPCLLSTIQYVESFYVNRLQGEEQYWWLQFTSAVEFIKTMDYSE